MGMTWSPADQVSGVSKEQFKVVDTALWQTVSSILSCLFFLPVIQA